MRKGKLIARYEDFGITIKDYYEIYEHDIDGIKFYMEKKYRSVHIENGVVSEERDMPNNIVNIYNNSDYLNRLGHHFGGMVVAEITWLEEMA